MSSLTMAVGGHDGSEGLIGPNAVTRLAEALAALDGEAARRSVFARAGLTRHLDSPPARMVPDEEVADLHAALVAELGLARAIRVGREAGRLTGLYLLANRIPAPARVALRLLPARFALAVLLRAIAGHAWTFAGAGAFSYRLKPTVELSIAGGPVSRRLVADEPVCAYYAATFETLFRALVSPRAVVEEVACQAMGAQACRFAARV